MMIIIIINVNDDDHDDEKNMYERNLGQVEEGSSMELRFKVSLNPS